MELSSEDIRQQIINDAKFDTQYLFTTKILDNGVNIKDRQLKHIITDIFDFDTIQQCIGRKRIIDDNDKINVYVKRFKQNSIQSYINQWNKYLKYGNEFMTLSKEEYLSKYGRFNTNGLVYNHLQSDGNIQLKLNDAYYYKLKSDIEDCEKITGYNQTTEFKIGHLKLLCDRYEIPVNDFKELDGSINMDTFNEQLAKFLNQKMFSEEQKVFKDFIKQNAVKIVSGSHGSLGINTINGYFEDNKIMYSLKSFQETGGERKGRRYWQLFRLT
jgi:hypothetical protein